MKIMFICTGNICRSAMAEGMMRKLAKENNKDISVYSAGIYAETGDYATYNAIEAARKYDVNIALHRATNIKDSKIEEMDLVLCATKSHKQTILQNYPALQGKVFTIKEYAEIDKEGINIDISDPWGYNSEVYSNCAEEIYDCLIKICDKC